MIKVQQVSKYSVAVFSLHFSSLIFAGGPLVLEGATGNTPVRYQNPDITIHVEDGDLGALPNVSANTLVQDAFDLWNQVNSSAVKLTINTTSINEDINLSNFEKYLPNIAQTNLNAEDNLNPLVYDNNGEIIDAYFGIGNSDTTVGFSASILGLGADYFDEGYTVINGKDIGLSATTFKLLITHEIGHFIGLDHSQGNINNQETSFGFPRICASSQPQDYPVMYPFVCRDTESLYADDISAISTLYPASTFNNNFGSIQGVFVDENSNAILGANIWAENISTGESYSIVSDYLKQGSGFYKLSLPAGTYTLHANSINPQFTGASGIGPYAQSSIDLSFTAPHPIKTITYQGDTAASDEVITLVNGRSQTINFSSSGAKVIIATAPDDKSGGASDLLGSTSVFTLLIIFGLPALARIIRIEKYKPLP